jgi:SAM-dependent methyltransferase
VTLAAEIGPPVPRSTHFSYNKLCNIEDFTHPALLPVIREVFEHELTRFGPGFPRGREYRKYWEVAMTVRALRDLGMLHAHAELLGVGAGNEPTVFHLTRSARRVFATDLYLASGAWGASANASMLTAPEGHWPFSWNPRRLVVQHMDALDLRYEDASFDGVFSSSSIEHFGDFGAVRRSAHEMFRVLKPGGVLALSTEFRLAGPSPGPPMTNMFSPSEIYEHIVGDDDWQLVSPLDTHMSNRTLATEVDFWEVDGDQSAQAEQHGGLFTFKVEYARYPHIVLRQDEYLFTSVHLTLAKSPRA